jgi:hypothetical protein
VREPGHLVAPANVNGGGVREPGYLVAPANVNCGWVGRLGSQPRRGSQVHSGAAAMIEITGTPRQGGIRCIRARRRSSRYTFMRVWSTKVYSGVAGDTEIHETPA